MWLAVADVAHGKLGVALALRQSFVEWCWLMLRHDSDSPELPRLGKRTLPA